MPTPKLHGRRSFLTSAGLAAAGLSLIASALARPALGAVTHPRLATHTKGRRSSGAGSSATHGLTQKRR